MTPFMPCKTPETEVKIQTEMMTILCLLYCVYSIMPVVRYTAQPAMSDRHTASQPVPLPLQEPPCRQRGQEHCVPLGPVQ